MAVTGAGGSSGSSNAAALAAQRAAEAQRRAEEARRRAEQARRERERAQQQAKEARERQQAAQKQLQAQREAARKAKGPDKAAAQQKVERAQSRYQTAAQERQQADRKLQEAEERVVRTAKIAEDEMRTANQAAASRPDVCAPAAFTESEIQQTGLKANEVRNAFVGAGRRREDLERTLGVSAGSTNQIQQSLEAERRFDQLDQDPKTSAVLDELDLRDGSDLQAFGQRLEREMRGGDRRADDVSLRSISDKDALSTVLEATGAAVGGRVQEVVGDDLARRLLVEGRPAERVANMSPEDRAVALYQLEVEPSVQKPLGEWTPEDAEAFTSALNEQIEQYQDDPEVVNALMTLSGPRLNRTTEILGNAVDDGDISQERIQGIVDDLSNIGNTLPPEAGLQLAYAVADKIPDGYEQQQVDDAFGAFIENGGDGKFRDLVAASLATQGKEDAAEEMIKEGAGGLLSDPIGFLEDRFEDITGAVGDVAGFLGGLAEKGIEAAYNFVGEQVVGRLGDAVRNAVVDTMNLDERIGDLQSPGDSFSAALGIEGNLLGAQLGVDLSVTVTRTEDGYEMELKGGGSAALAEKLGLPGLGEAELEGELGASATMTFAFESEEEIVQATETVAGVATGVAALGAGPLAPVGAAMIASAGDEIGQVAGAYQSTTLSLEARGSLGADLGQQLGIPGAEAGVEAGARISIEIPREGPPTLILNQHLEGDLSFSAGEVPLPGGGTLTAGAGASASMELETRVPIDVDVGELVSDPLGAVRDAGEAAIEGATTTFKGDVEFQAGAGIQGGPNELGANEGLEVSFEATAATRDLGAALGRAATGDVSGAIRLLGRQTELSAEVRAFTQTEAGLGSAEENVDGDGNQEVEGQGVSVPGLGSLEVTASVASRSSRILTSFEGTPAELLRDFGGVLGTVNFAA